MRCSIAGHGARALWGSPLAWLAAGALAGHLLALAGLPGNGNRSRARRLLAAVLPAPLTLYVIAALRHRRGGR